MRPSIVSTCLKTINFVIGIVSMLSNIEISIRTYSYSLRVAVTVRIDVAFNTVDLWIVVGDGAIRIHAEYFTFIFSPILGSNLFRSWEMLGPVIQSEQSELVFALITYSIV